MATDKSTIPIISITTSEDTNNQPGLVKHYHQVSPEPLTDLEDLDQEAGHVFLGTLKIDEDFLTDAEIVEASDDERDISYIPKASVQLDQIIEYGGTHEELVRVTNPRSLYQEEKVESSVSTSKIDSIPGFLNTLFEKDGLTDLEDFDMSDEEDNVDEEVKELLENEDILNKFTDDGTVDISDRIRKNSAPSPAVTPDLGEKRYHKKGKGNKKVGNTRRKKLNENLLSPKSLSPHLSDITDTEIVYSDSEEDISFKQRPISPQERRRKHKQLKGNDQTISRQKVADVTYNANLLPELEISNVHISEKVPVKELVSESDTDNAYSMPHNNIFNSPRKKTLMMEIAGALLKDNFVNTDVEHFESSSESENDVDADTGQLLHHRNTFGKSQYKLTKEKESMKDNLLQPMQDTVILTDTEYIDTECESAKCDLGASVSKKSGYLSESTEEDNFDVTDVEYLAAVKELRARAWKESNYEIRFVDVDSKIRPLAITPDLPQVTTSSSLQPPYQNNMYTTDTEDLVDENDFDISKTYLSVHSSTHDEGLTDTEIFYGEDEISRPKSPEPSEEENSQVLPEPTREMILMKEDLSGRPVSVVLPLGNIEPDGLRAPYIELGGSVSEVEDMITDDDEVSSIPVHEPCITPDIVNIDSSVIHSSEIMKMQKKKLKVVGEGTSEPLTDTEDVFLSVSSKRKRSKTKLKLGLEPKPHYFREDLTDTEELISDIENQKKMILTTPQVESDPVTDVDDVDISGDDETRNFHRSLAVTPDYFKELGDSYTTSKEGNEPFTEEVRQSFLSLNTVPIINTISPSPDIQFTMNTDTEDMVASADEDGFSQAETVTPYDGEMELEDHSSFVYMKHTQKFDLDAPEEAVHIKGAVDIHETYTDIEDLGLSEDERPKPPEQLFVNDTADQVCVCLNSEVEDEDSVCVCVSKEHGGLSLVWNSKNSTNSKQHRDWAEKRKSDSTVDSSKKEGEEELLDLATGLQDTKGSSAHTGSGTSSTK